MGLKHQLISKSKDNGFTPEEVLRHYEEAKKMLPPQYMKSKVVFGIIYAVLSIVGLYLLFFGDFVDNYSTAFLFGLLVGCCVGKSISNFATCKNY